MAPLDSATAAELTELFFAANAIERRLILLNLNIVAPVSAGGIRVTRDASANQRLETAALGGNREGFAQDLARALQIPREQARRIVRDDLGEPVVVAAKALNMPRQVLYRVLMFVNPMVGHSVERVHALAALNDEMAQSAAEGMVAIWQALGLRDRAVSKQQPLAWDDETRRRAPPTAAATQRIPMTQRTSGRRNCIIAAAANRQRCRGNCDPRGPRPRRSRHQDRISAAARDKPQHLRPAPTGSQGSG